MTTLQKSIIVATLAAAICAGVYQARRASHLLSQVQELQRQHAPLIEEVQQLEQERDTAKRQLAGLRDKNEHTAELLKLRGDVGVLRKQLAEVNMAKSQSSALMPQASQPSDLLEQQKQTARIKGLDGRNYSMHFISFASDNQGWLPTNWQQVASLTNDYPVTGTNEFELIHRRPLNLFELGTNAGRTILVREYLSWPTFDGHWGKIYGFADGHSDTIILPDGSFTAWEQQNTFDPESVSK